MILRSSYSNNNTMKEKVHMIYLPAWIELDMTHVYIAPIHKISTLQFGVHFV